LTSWYSDLNVAGLAYDAAGIVVFGVPAAISRGRDLVAATEATFDVDKGTLRILAEQKWDTCVGSLLLCAGFTFQILATQQWVLKNSGSIVVWAALPFVTVGYLLVRRRFVGWYYGRLEKLALAAAK
jgi:hypothetical protein